LVRWDWPSINRIQPRWLTEICLHVALIFFFVVGCTIAANAQCTLTSSPSAFTEVGVSYSQANTASLCTAPLTFSLASGALPSGTTLDPSTGTVSGTPSSQGFFNYTIQVTDAGSAVSQASSSGTIAPVLTLTATPSATAQVGVPYSQTNAATGGTTPYSYSLASGSLPGGTNLDPATGTVSGTPTTQGAFNYAIRVTGAGSSAAQASSNGTIAPALSLTANPSAAAQVGQAYSQTNIASGGTTPYVFSLASGSLPAGTSLDTSNGTVSGTPTTQGPFSYTIKVTDAGSATAQTSSSGTIAPGALAIVATASIIAQVGQNYSQTNVASGGSTPYTYSLASGSLPAGTSLDTATGTVSGTPTTQGAFSYIIRVTDAGAANAQASTTGTITPVTLTMTSAASATTQVGQSYSQTNVASGGTTPYTYSLGSGSLPAGTSLNPSTGTVSGTPTTPGLFSYTITVTDSTTPIAQTATAASSGTIATTTTTTSLHSSVNPSVLGQPVTFTATVSGGSSPSGTVTFSDGGSQLGTVSLAGITATFTTSSLSLGNHAITARYNGNANNAASSSAVLQQSVAIPADSIRLRQMQILGTQQSAQLSGQNISGAISNAIDNAFSGNVQAVTPNGSGFTYNFAAEGPAVPPAGGWQAGGSAADNRVREFMAAPDRTTSNLVEHGFSALGYSGITRAPPRTPPRAPPPDWLAWVDVRGISFSNHAPGTDLRGDQLNVTAGLTRRLGPDLVIGGFGGFEHLDFNSDALNSRLKGDGWTVGGYLGWQLAPDMRFDMMLGRSAIGYNDTAGTASATFRGVRWLASGGLTGTYEVRGFLLQPLAKLYALWERDDAYVDSLGIAQPSYSFSTGRASAGTRVSYPFAWSSATSFAPYSGVYGDYYFTGNQAAVAGVPTIPLLLQGWSARVAAGLDMKFNNGGTIGFGGELGGLGSHTSVLTYKLRGSLPF
jgi:hypothetical protein